MENENAGTPSHGGSRCFVCDSTEVTKRQIEDRIVVETILGVAAKTVTLPGEFCAACGSSVVAEEGEEARDRIVEELRRRTVAEDVQHVRRGSHLTRDEWLSLSRVGDASLSRWENGSNDVNAANIHYLYLLSFPDNLKRLEARRAKMDRETVGLKSAHAAGKTVVSEYLARVFPGSKFTPEHVEEALRFDPSPSELAV